MAAPRRPTKPKAKRLILNLMLAAGSQPMGVRDLITACRLFGVAETSVRVALTRLSSEQLIQGAGRGQYSLGPAATGLASGVGGWRTAAERLERWSGQWLAVHCGGLGRTDRMAVRHRERVLEMNGFKALEKDLYVRPDCLAGGVQEMRDRLYSMGLEPQAPVFALSGLDADREGQARALWDGKQLARAYRETRETLEHWLMNCEALDPEEAARESFVIGDAAIRQLVYDPLLPSELVDVSERQAFIDALQRFDQAGHAIWTALYQTVLGNEPAKSSGKWVH